jgi:exopolyphosphatase/guanosine-5'-triphosphate,3'-diphosphate pyrophosphatase
MRVGVIDVGANTMRLLVAARAGSGLTTVHRERIQLGLGEFIEQGGDIPQDRLQATGRAARDQAASARRLGCSRIEIVVTSPGRQAENADELIAALERVRGASARVLTAEEEASFAYRAVVASVDDSSPTVAVCDVGGGSTQLAVGSSADEPSWVRSLDVGSLRLTRRAFGDDPPTANRARQRQETAELFAARAAFAARRVQRRSARALGSRRAPPRPAEPPSLRIVIELIAQGLREIVRPEPARARTLSRSATVSRRRSSCSVPSRSTRRAS